MKTILSTKKLSIAQKEHLLNAGLAVVDIDFIQTETLLFKTPNKPIENAIFTSQNGIKAVLKENTTINNIKNCYCVGTQTTLALKHQDKTIAYSATNAKELAHHIISQKPTLKFHYFCGKNRLNTLPDEFIKNNINWVEIPVYQTIHTPKTYTHQFDAVLFFSPSGVDSYFNKNKIPTHSFCIGNTTAKTLKKYTSTFTIATQPSIENVLIKVIKHFNSND